MSRTSIPHTTLNVFPICLGTGEIGTKLDRERSFALLDSYVELGGNFIDTAHNYGDWVKTAPRSACESMLGEWLRLDGGRNRNRVVLATKGAYPLLDGNNVPRSSRQEIEADLDASLRCLQTDVIDLYWIHRDDPTRPVEEYIETLEAQVRAGKIRYYGASNFAASRLRAAHRYAEARGYRGFVADQVLWNAGVLAKYPYGDPGVGFMDADRYLFHLETRMAAIPFQSQAYGLFNRIDAGTLEQMNPGFRSFYRVPETQARYERMRKVMQETGFTITQVILAYLTSQPFPTVPIVGCQNPQQVADSMSAADVSLTPEQRDFIGKPVQSLPDDQMDSAQLEEIDRLCKSLNARLEQIYSPLSADDEENVRNASLPAGAEDNAEFAELWAKHENQIFNFLVRMTEDKLEASELTRETYHKASRGYERARLLFESRMFTWLNTCAFLVYRRYHPRRRGS